MTRIKTRTLPEDREVFSLRRDRPIAGAPMSLVRPKWRSAPGLARIIAGASAASG
jgi:hypothetical protein